MSFMSLGQFHGLSSIMSMTTIWAATVSVEKYLKKYGERKDLKKARRKNSEDFKITLKKIL